MAGDLATVRRSITCAAPRPRTRECPTIALLLCIVAGRCAAPRGRWRARPVVERVVLARHGSGRFFMALAGDQHHIAGSCPGHPLGFDRRRASRPLDHSYVGAALSARRPGSRGGSPRILTAVVVVGHDHQSPARRRCGPNRCNVCPGRDRHRPRTPRPPGCPAGRQYRSTRSNARSYARYYSRPARGSLAAFDLLDTPVGLGCAAARPTSCSGETPTTSDRPVRQGNWRCCNPPGSRIPSGDDNPPVRPP